MQNQQKENTKAIHTRTSYLASILLVDFPRTENRPKDGAIDISPLSSQIFFLALCLTHLALNIRPINLLPPRLIVVKLGPIERPVATPSTKATPQRLQFNY